MNRLISVLLALMACMGAVALAENESIDVTMLSLSELNALSSELERVITAYHTPVKTVQDLALASTKEAAEAYLSTRGTDVSWAWFPNEYTYTRAWDLYTVSTHADYKDTDGNQQQVTIYAELFPNNSQYQVFFLTVGDATVTDNRGSLPQNTWKTTPVAVIDAATGCNLAVMSLQDINALIEEIKAEITISHTTDSTTNDVILKLAKTEVETYFSNKGIAISWPWFGYEYSNVHRLYTLATSIDYTDENNHKQHAAVFAAAYPKQGTYTLRHLTVGETVLLDKRDTLPSNLQGLVEQAIATPTPMPTGTPAVEAKYTPIPTLDPSIQRHYLGSLVNTGTDNGYSGQNAIDVNDPHFGWRLGRFFVSGYTNVTEDTDSPIFLKTVGDQVTLWFSLEQDIASLNNNAQMTIASDANGYDQYYGIPKSDEGFGRGTLIIRHRDFQNKDNEPMVYTDYLTASVATGADTQVRLCEEGDYEVALNYEIKDKHVVAGVPTVDRYNNYRIFFRFSVRNGNCMVYPFDVVTGEELTNTAITPNGFCLDLARSRYLDINIRKQVLMDGAEGLVEDTRFNRPAKDGDQYTDEGIYEITVSNRYTGQQTTKLIYVGTDPTLMEYVTTGQMGN